MAPAISSDYAARVHAIFLTSAAGDALKVGAQPAVCGSDGVQTASGAVGKAIGENTQLLCYTLDGITEVLEWNNQGAAADELACLWLAYLRWYRGAGYSLAAHAPVPQPRPIDEGGAFRTRREPDEAILKALADGQMQTVTNNINPQALGSGALVRSAAVGVLPVASERTVAHLAIHGAALTHGHPEVLACCGAYALLVRSLLGQATSGREPSIARALRRIIDWCDTLTDRVIPGDISRTRHVLDTALRLGNMAPSPPAIAEHFGTDRPCFTVLGIGVWHALYTENVFVRADEAQLENALLNAAAIPDSGDTTALVGAILGARYGTVPFLPPEDSEIRAVITRYLAQLH